MPKVNIPFFTEIDFGEIPRSIIHNNYLVLDSKIKLRSKEVKLDLWMDTNEDLNAISFDTLASVLDQLEDYDEFSITYISENLGREDGSEHVKLYFEFLEEECSITKDNALNQIYLHRIGFYPNSLSAYAVFDYSLDHDIVGNQLLALKFGSDGKFSYIGWES